MDIVAPPVSILSETDCWNLMSGVALGRLITSVDGEPEVFPVNYVVQRRTVLFRTGVGTKLISAAINHRVAFEADDHGVTEGWSVVVKGMARILWTTEEIYEAERAQVLPWTATAKHHWVRVRPLTVTGRRFVFGPEPGGESALA
jgi:nitroimidazol reductase NimA-like FMN-containing flavoprotein (pyridoxamine 5'-phosphate oxidase superfamily)